MTPRTFGAATFLTVLVCCRPSVGIAESPRLEIDANFEGASVSAVEIDQKKRSIQFSPGGDPSRGWPCWWFFMVWGLDSGETITLRLKASTATSNEPGSPLKKPLSPSWAMPDRATFSADGRTWQHSEKGVRENGEMQYTLSPGSDAVYVAWGPPYTPGFAAGAVEETCRQQKGAKAAELCRSAGGRAVAMWHVAEGPRPAAKRFGVWVQARQHAWESGSSWVAQGFAEWLLGDSEQAAWVRSHAEVSIVPVMDVDNVATGNGGKDAMPHDHNRDWSEFPHWKETAAAQARVKSLIAEGRMDVFLDLHNPAPGDPTFFFVLEPAQMTAEAQLRHNRFIELAYKQISTAKPFIPMSNKPKFLGAAYHPLWKQISANWVSMNGNPHTVALCLETIWNAPAGTTAGYRTVGASLGLAVAGYLREQAARE